MGLKKEHLASIVPSFGDQGSLKAEVAALLNLRSGIPVSYRAGDQPNNAFSLNVLEPGEIAATAGTSGVVYGVTDKVVYDAHSRVNSFVHVNHSHNHPRYGVLMCLNGTGILNSWARKNIFNGMEYEQINQLASTVSIGAEGVRCYPFGNGAERILRNQHPGAAIEGLNFNLHGQAHIARAVQEGIVFALNYGIEIMKEMGMEITKVRAGHANMFMSEIFGEAFSNTTGCQVELYNTDGAVGAARAAGVGAGIFKDFKESFQGLEIIRSIYPEKEKMEAYGHAYTKWKEFMTT
jgi:xylulokinase